MLHRKLITQENPLNLIPSQLLSQCKVRWFTINTGI